MKKALILFVIMVVLASALFFVFIRLFGREIDIPIHSASLLIVLSGPSIIYIKSLSRLRYLEKTDTRNPSFKIAERSCILADQSIDFDSL